MLWAIGRKVDFEPAMNEVKVEEAKRNENKYLLMLCGMYLKQFHKQRLLNLKLRVTPISIKSVFMLTMALNLFFQRFYPT
ncbi:hypothetical protein DP115_09850 [Brasilonema octagenarum UFV-OR1]|uniref:Uncharacterized protein n=1 Tax=Brasilonema octagenarum UFV-OR1 TaxID=417115 RepID=A0ABX1M3I3_9CYAN|nr:hypothetical protein [Brasilonema octagenarum UFV-OR1]